MSGLLDPVVVDFVRDSIERAERSDAVALVLQLNSSGTVVDDGDIDALVGVLSRSPIPVAVWVGPSGARAYDGAVALVRAADVAGMAPGTRVGLGGGAPRTLGPADARRQRLVDITPPTLGDLIVELDGRRVDGQVLDTADVISTPDGPRRRPTVAVSFAKLPLLPRLLHTVASPPVAFLLLVAGLLLIVFEFFTAGVGVAGVTGAGCLVLACYGLDVLPARWWSLALVAVALFGFSVDLQAGAPRLWTVIGTVSLAMAAANLYGGHSVGVVPLLVAVVGVPLFMVAAMPAVIRARFSTPTIGRESMIGETGTATQPVSPEGMVSVRGALWRARTSRVTPIAAGAPVRVVAIDGLLLEVEPENGAAAGPPGVPAEGFPPS